MKYFKNLQEQKAEENRKRISKEVMDQLKGMLDSYPNKGAELYSNALRNMKEDLDEKLRTTGLFPKH
jgi:hypothetical protein